jgi:hypothetical protein
MGACRDALPEEDMLPKAVLSVTMIAEEPSSIGQRGLTDWLVKA